MMKRIAGLVLAAVVLFALTGCAGLDALAKLEAKTSPSVYEEASDTDVVGDVTFPPESQKAGWDFSDMGDVAKLTAYYEDITLAQAMDFLGGLEAGGWYLTGHYAYKGARSADIYYSMGTRSLQTAFTLVKGTPAWPDGTLTPYLAYLTTPFPYGTFAGCEEDGTGKAFTLTYEDTGSAELIRYMDTLLAMGYTTDDGKTLMDETTYVSYSYDYETKTATITVGLQDIQMVPLPPWPEPMPENLAGLLPPVGAVISVTGSEDGFYAKAEDLSLSELYGFVSSAPKYGWSALTDQNEMTHAESGFTLRFLSYESQTGIMTLTIWNTEGGEPQTGNIEESEQATQSEQTQDEGLSEETEESYQYVLTQGKYGESGLDAAIKAEYGEDAQLADFLEIKALFGNDFPAFLDRIGMQVHEDVWVGYAGDEYFGDERHYFMERMSGTSRDDFMIQDQVGDEAWLGSWYGMQLRALAKIPDKSA